MYTLINHVCVLRPKAQWCLAGIRATLPGWQRTGLNALQQQLQLHVMHSKVQAYSPHSEGLLHGLLVAAV